MNGKMAIAGLAGVGLMVLSQTASANFINITSEGLPGGISVVGNDLNGTKDVAPKVSSVGDEQLWAWLHDQWSAEGQSEGLKEPLPQIIASGTTLAGANFGDYVGEYLVLHWGMGQAGQLFDKDNKPNGGFLQAFYIEAGGDYSIALPALTDGSKTKDVGGLSFWSIYDPPSQVPDNGMTLTLLGMGFGLMLWVEARRSQRQAAAVRSK
jgi:hypothetical protein